MNSLLKFKLKDAMELGKRFGWDDIDIIKFYLQQDGIGAETLDMLTGILKGKISDLERYKNYVRGNMPYSTDYYYKEYVIEVAEVLDTLTRKMMLDMPFTKKDLEWMKDFELPKSGCFWRDLAEAIKGVQNPTYTPYFFGIYSQWDNRGKE